MNIALIGYGKMGKTIAQIAEERGHTIVAKLSQSPTSEDLQKADVAIEFSRPETAFKNISFCIQQQLPIVSGTTGWLSHLKEIEQQVLAENGSFIYASNFSLGVNLYLEMAKKMTQLMQGYPNYLLEVEEIHHTEKRDAPSGTAITIAETLIGNSNYQTWSLDDKKDDTDIPIFAKRIDQVPGTHSIRFVSEEDTIELNHIAHSRKGFALGAVIAAEYIHTRTGIFTMKDVLGIS